MCQVHNETVTKGFLVLHFWGYQTSFEGAFKFIQLFPPNCTQRIVSSKLDLLEVAPIVWAIALEEEYARVQ